MLPFGETKQICLQVAVTLLEPLQEGGALAAAAARVLEAIVGRHRPLLGEQISALPPLPASLPALGKVAEALAAERGRLGPAEQVQLLLRSLDHQSVNVRATALQARLPPAVWSCPESTSCCNVIGVALVEVKEEIMLVDVMYRIRCHPSTKRDHLAGNNPGETTTVSRSMQSQEHLSGWSRGCFCLERLSSAVWL